MDFEVGRRILTGL